MHLLGTVSIYDEPRMREEGYRGGESNSAEQSVDDDHEDDGDNLVLNISLREVVEMLTNVTERDDNGNEREH